MVIPSVPAAMEFRPRAARGPYRVSAVSVAGEQPSHERPRQTGERPDAPKSPGQLAYEEDCRRCPTYHDGAPRCGWSQISDIARWSWERDPTPREFKHRVSS